MFTNIECVENAQAATLGEWADYAKAPRPSRFFGCVSTLRRSLCVGDIHLLGGRNIYGTRTSHLTKRILLLLLRKRS